jgi:HK97 family phage prohead protease
MTLALCGYATLWNKMGTNHGVTMTVLPGAFGSTLRTLQWSPVRLLLNHFDEQRMGSTDDNLELYSDENGLAFRFRITDTEDGQCVRSMAEDSHNSMSLWFDYPNAQKETRSINGVDTVCIISATLREISFLHGYNAGVVRDAFATLKNADYGKSLKDECSNGRFLYDNAAVNFSRSLQGLMRHLDGY